MNSPFDLLNRSAHVLLLAKTILLFFFFNNPIVVVARPQDPVEMRLAELPGRKPVLSQEEQIAKWKSWIGSTCSYESFNGGHWVDPSTCDAKAAKGECICPLYFEEQREDAGFISTIIQCCVPAPCADPNLSRGSSCMDSTKGDLCFDGSGRFLSETNYGKACPGFPENIECCVNSDDTPPSELEQLIRMMNSNLIKDKHGSQSADLWPLSTDAVSWLDTTPQDIYLV